MQFFNFRGKRLYQIMSFSSALSFAMYGYDAGVLAGVQDTQPFRDGLGLSLERANELLPIIASSFTLGAWVMSMLVSLIALRLGRRGCLLCGNTLVIIGGAIQAAAMSVPHIIVGRVLCGFGVGFVSSTVPTYMAEMSMEHSARGPEVSFQSMILIAGVALAGWVDFGFTRMSNQVSWRFPIAFQTVFPILSNIGVFFTPDTPRWYYVRGRIDEGDNTLAALHDLPIANEHVQARKKEILDAVRFEASQPPFQLKTLLWDNTRLQAGRRLRTSGLIMAIQQLMGINMIIYYSTIIFSQLQLSSFLSHLLAAVMNTVFAAGTIFTGPTIEKVGRRSIMLYSSIVLSATLLIFVVMVNLGDNRTTATQWTAVAAVVAHVFCFGYGWVGVPWLYGPELAPVRYRHLAGSYAATGEWSMTFVTVYAGGVALQRAGPLTWIWFFLFCVISWFYVYFCCPETSNKTLEQIDEIFTKRVESIDVETQEMEGEKASKANIEIATEG